MLSLVTSWVTTLSLIFGGCCSNAVTLEQLTLQHPNAGSILTFFQFLLIALYGLPKFLVWTWLGPRFRLRRVPIVQYLLQVGLFYLVNLLNNAAFAYRIPMAVHIIFRSGGLIISMLLGWLISGKRYNIVQTASVLFVTAGVILTTLSASKPSASTSSNPQDPYTYATGIGVLTLALVLSGFLGLAQDRTATKYLRNAPPPRPSAPYQPPAWQESMFYLHFLALPMFYPLLPSIVSQMQQLNTAGPRVAFDVLLPFAPSSNLTTTYPLGVLPPYSLPSLPIHFFPNTGDQSILSLTQPIVQLHPTPSPSSSSSSSSFAEPQLIPRYPIILSLSIPQIYLPLILNTITQLLCVAGVHRLTTRVSALTVTLVLVVRKAASLIISIVGLFNVIQAFEDAVCALVVRMGAALGVGPETLGERTVGYLERGVEWAGWGVDVVVGALVGSGKAVGKAAREVNEDMMWLGAAMVLLGTVGYTIGSRSSGTSKAKSSKDKVE